jgi:hypothetical protein
VLCVHRWSDDLGSIPRAGLVGLLAGLVILVRPTNAIVLLLVPLLGVSSVATLRARLGALLHHPPAVAVATALMVATVLPQLLVWHVATGSWFVASYSEAGGHFDFGSPALLDVLFSFGPHGLLPWAPVLVLAVVGVVPLWRRARGLVLPVVVILALHTYIVASWWMWFYANGFGHRAFVDVMGLFAFPLAALFSSLRRPSTRRAIGALSAALVLVTAVQMVNYWRQRIPPTGASAREYFTILIGR